MGAGRQDNNRGHCVGGMKWVNKAAIILHLFTYKGVSNMSAVLNKELLMYQDSKGNRCQFRWK